MAIGTKMPGPRCQSLQSRKQLAPQDVTSAAECMTAVCNLWSGHERLLTSGDDAHTWVLQVSCWQAGALSPRQHVQRHALNSTNTKS